MATHTNTLYTGDNLYILNGMNSASVDLIYLDPPFNSKRIYSAPVGSQSAGASFNDLWSWQDVDQQLLESIVSDYPFLVQFIQSIGAIHSPAMKAYATYMTQRFIQLHRVLKPSGSFYIHIDPTASHYLKIILDRIFDKGNFRNEIIWYYDGPQRPSVKNFATKHDVILRYTKSADYYTNPEGIKPFRKLQQAEIKRFKRLPDGRYYYTTPRGDYTDESIQRLDKADRIEYTGKGNARVRHFARTNAQGEVGRNKQLHDVWTDLVSIGHAGGKERTGYPTQKPLALLQRIIMASSKAGDIVFDPFCGCATALVAAQQLDRKWLGIDIEAKAAEVLIHRLSDDAGLFSDFVHRADCPERTDIETISPKDNTARERLHRQQNGSCMACALTGDPRHFHVDHIIPKSKGGGDYYANYQLLCGSCNSIKGNRPMEYLNARIARINAAKNQLSF